MLPFVLFRREDKRKARGKCDGRGANRRYSSNVRKTLRKRLLRRLSATGGATGGARNNNQVLGIVLASAAGRGYDRYERCLRRGLVSCDHDDIGCR